MASTGASLERRLERLETAYRARRQPQITVVRLVDEDPSDELTQREDVLVIQRVMVAPPEREPEQPIIETPAEAKAIFGGGHDRPRRAEERPTRFSRIIDYPKVGLV
jgi:hypothetical protein